MFQRAGTKAENPVTPAAPSDMNTHRPAIEAIGLGRDYGSTRALAAIDLAVPR